MFLGIISLVMNTGKVVIVLKLSTVAHFLCLI